jgi:asparagine synthase (glutamine-hydrolysing)
MRHSVETRLPFIDYDFAQSAVSIKDSLKFKNGYLKYILRKVVTNILPKSIAWRTNKFGFEAPTDMWIDSYKETMMFEIKKSKILEKTVHINDNILNDYNILWRFFNIAIWEKIYEVKI